AGEIDGQREQAAVLEQFQPRTGVGSSPRSDRRAAPGAIQVEVSGCQALVDGGEIHGAVLSPACPSRSFPDCRLRGAATMPKAEGRPLESGHPVADGQETSLSPVPRQNQRIFRASTTSAEIDPRLETRRFRRL